MGNKMIWLGLAGPMGVILSPRSCAAARDDGFIAYDNFTDFGNPAHDSSGNGFDGTADGFAHPMPKNN
jgi:hypothetical protein